MTKSKNFHLDMRVAIDLSGILSEDNINGAMYVFNATDERDLVEKLSSKVVEDVIKSIGKHRFVNGLIDASVNPLTENVMEQHNPQEEGEVEYERLEPTVESNDNEFEDTSDYKEVEPEGEEEFYDYENYQNMLFDMVRNDMFKIKSYVGDIKNIYIKDYDKYSEALEELVTGTFIELLPIEDAPTSYLKDIDYIIEFTDINGTIRYGKNSFKKIKEELKGEGE